MNQGLPPIALTATKLVSTSCVAGALWSFGGILIPWGARAAREPAQLGEHQGTSSGSPRSSGFSELR
jgi:hypothetical protein